MANAYSFVPATREQVENIRRQLGTDEEDIRRAVAALRDWLSKQPHLPDHIGDTHLEKMYIYCKCSTEKVKRGLDFYFSLKNKFPQLLMNRDPLGPDVVTTLQHLKYVVMPRLTKQLCRVYLFADVDPDARWVSWTRFGKLASIGAEVLYLEDYSLGDILVVDMRNVTAAHVLRSDVNVIRAIEFTHKNAYCRRVKALHYVNADKVTDYLLKLLKASLSEKLQKRIHVHLPGSATLLDHLAREDLPDELGGTAGPLHKLSSEFMKLAESRRAWLLEQDRYTSDESKRPRENPYADDLFGVQGSFKTLSVD